MCPDENTLVEYVEGRLAPEKASEIGVHSESCADCRKLIVALTRLRSGSEPTIPASSPPAPEEELGAGANLGRYVIEKKVGAGAMGVVYQAHDPALNRRVALKLLHGTGPDSHARLTREGQAVAKLSHPNVVTVHDVGEHGGRSFVAMELIAGLTLREWLKQKSPTQAQRLVALTAAGEGLAAAHAAGIVHRDFKPDNVLIDGAGRVVVTDFGLASDPDAIAGHPESSRGSRLHATQTGMLMGTPAYMAPELLEGQRADVRSDQFSFCVTCHEVLGGLRPFIAEDLAALKAAMLAERLEHPLPGTVPVQVRAAISRGLNPKPSLRFPSMRALLAELAPRQRSPAWVPVLGAAAVIALILGGVFTARGQLCSGAAAKLDPVWNRGRRDGITGAFKATGVPFAGASAEAVTAGLDRWSQRWSEQWVNACEATRVRGEQSESMLDLRMRCLDARLAEVRSLTEALSRADEATVTAAPNALTRLDPVAVCADLEGLSAPVRPPSAELQSALAPLREEQAQLNGLVAAAKYKEAFARAEPLLARATALKYRPFEAELQVQLAEVKLALDDYPGAEAALTRAVVAGEAGGHLAVSGQAWAKLIHVYAEKLAKYPLAHVASDHSEAALERLGSPAALEALVRRNQGELSYSENKFDAAFAQYERALALQEAQEKDSVQVAATLNAMGNARRQQGEGAKAVELHRKALELLRAKLGDDHPDVALATKNVGNDYWHDSKLDEAFDWYRKAEKIQIAALGENSLEVASTRNNVAAVLIRQQKLDEAEGVLNQVLATREAKLGADHPSLYGELNNLAVVYRYKEKLDLAEKSLRRALAISLKAHPEHEDVATTLINLGDVQLAGHDFQASVDSYEQAAALTEKLVGPDHPNLADCFGGEAFPLIQLKRWQRALSLTEHALAIYAKKPGIPMVEAQVHFAHAEAQWETDKPKRKGAHAEALAARETMSKAGAQPSDLLEMDTWLKGH